MLTPMVPHLAEELWEMLGHTGGARRARRGREFVPQLAEEEQVEIVIQINGRVRGKIRVEAGLGRERAGGAGARPIHEIEPLAAGQRRC